MKCPKCGKEIDANSKFCEYCGTQIKKNRKPLFITIAIVACLLILGGIGLTQYNKGEQERTRLERELSMYKLKAEKAELKANAEHEARLKSEAESSRLEREAAEKARYNGHEYVDLGLPSGLKWATCNVGASKPEDYGNYYAWGETSTKEPYDNCPTDGLSISQLQSQGYIDSEGNLTSQYDAATANWGGKWRMPTYDELYELHYNCIWTWTTQNGVNGYKVTGPNGNSIFLPAAGNHYGSSLYSAGELGDYWSSAPSDGYDGSYAYCLGFYSAIQGMGGHYRGDGLSVRPVIE